MSSPSLPAAARTFDVFLSHNWAHKPVVEAFARQLKERSVSVWVDHERMTGFMDDTIKAALADSRVVIAFLSRHYLASPICREELRIAAEDPVTRVIPVRLEAPPFKDGATRAAAVARRDDLKSALASADADGAGVLAEIAAIEADLVFDASYADAFGRILRRSSDGAALYFERAESSKWDEYARLWTAGGYADIARSAEALQRGDLQAARARIDWGRELLDVAFPGTEGDGHERFDNFVQKHALVGNLVGSSGRGGGTAPFFTPLSVPLSPRDVTDGLAAKNAELVLLPSFIDAGRASKIKIQPQPLSLCRFRARAVAGADAGAGASGSEAPSAAASSSWNDGAERERGLEEYNAGTAAVKDLTSDTDGNFHVLAGVAGAGKTCLLRVMARCHASARRTTPEAYMDLSSDDFSDFQRVILLRLRDLEALFSKVAWKSTVDALRSTTTPQDAAAFVVASAYSLPPDPPYTRALALNLFSDASDDARRTLWLLDGFDELGAEERAKAAALARTASGTAAGVRATPNAARMLPSDLVHAVMELLVAQRHVVITTRPAFAAQLCQRYIRIEPLAQNQVINFCSEALSMSREEAVSLFNAQLLEAMLTPVIMAMAVAAFGRASSSAPSSAAAAWVHPVTDLYTRIVDSMREKFIVKGGDAGLWPHALHALRRIALRGCARGAYSKLTWEWAGEGVSVEATSPFLAFIQSAGVVDFFADGTVEFAHRSLQEFFAAHTVVDGLCGVISGASGVRADDNERAPAAILDDERTALLADSNDALRRFTFSLARSKERVDILVRAVWDFTNASDGNRVEQSMRNLSECIQCTDPSLLSALKCTSFVRARAKLHWAAPGSQRISTQAHLQPSLLSDTFWEIADALCPEQTVPPALDELEGFIAAYRNANWPNDRSVQAPLAFPSSSISINAVGVLAAVLLRRKRDGFGESIALARTVVAETDEVEDFASPRLWQNKTTATRCASAKCSKAFGFFRWAYNCLRCGFLFCTACAPTRAAQKHLRLCLHCLSDVASHSVVPDVSVNDRIARAFEASVRVRIGAVRVQAIIAVGKLGGLGDERSALLALACGDGQEIGVRKAAIAELGYRHRKDLHVCERLLSLAAPVLLPSPSTTITIATLSMLLEPLASSEFVAPIDALRALARTLRTDVRDSDICRGATLAILGITNLSRENDKATELDILLRLVLVLKSHAANVDIVRNAVGAIRNLSALNAGVDTEVLSALVSSFWKHSLDLDICLAMCEAIRNIAARPTANNVAALGTGTLHALFGALTNFTFNDRVCLFASGAVSSLCDLSSNARLAIKEIPILVKVAKRMYANIDVCTQLCGAIEKITNSSEGAAAALKAGALPFLVTTLLDHAKYILITQSASCSIKNITTISAGVSAALETGTLAPLVCALRAHVKSPIICINVSIAVKHIAGGGVTTKGKADALAAGALQCLFAAYEEHTAATKVRRTIIDAIQCFSAFLEKQQASRLTTLRRIGWTALEEVHFPISELNGGNFRIIRASTGIRDLAIKLLKPADLANPSRQLILERELCREIENLAAANDGLLDGVIEFVGIAEGPLGPHWSRRFEISAERADILGMVMAWAPMGSLYQRLQKENTQNARTLETLKFLKPLVDCVKQLHDRATIHGNISSETILLGKRGNIVVPLLANFRSAIRGGLASPFATSEDKGTSLHRSKPQDIYALAKVMWEELAKQSFTDSELQFTLSRDVRPPRRDVPYVLHRMLRQALLCDVADRPQISHLIASLEEALREVEKHEFHVFLSHSWEGRGHAPITTFVKDRLATNDFPRAMRLLIDFEHMGAETVEKKLTQGIDSSLVVVILLSRAYTESRICMFEFLYAKAINKPIVCALVEPDLRWSPPEAASFLFRSVWSDLRETAQRASATAHAVAVLSESPTEHNLLSVAAHKEALDRSAAHPLAIPKLLEHIFLKLGWMSDSYNGRATRFTNVATVSHLASFPSTVSSFASFTATNSPLTSFASAESFLSSTVDHERIKRDASEAASMARDAARLIKEETAARITAAFAVTLTHAAAEAAAHTAGGATAATVVHSAAAEDAANVFTSRTLTVAGDMGFRVSEAAFRGSSEASAAYDSRWRDLEAQALPSPPYVNMAHPLAAGIPHHEENVGTLGRTRSILVSESRGVRGAASSTDVLHIASADTVL